MYTTSQHSDGPEQLQRRRRRPPLACIACRRRKVRCDRKMPCQNCVRARRATSCAYVPDDRLEPRDRLADSQSLIEEEDHDEDDYSNRGGRAQAFHNVLDNRTSGKPDAGVRTAAGTASGLTGPYLTPDTTSGSSSANNHHHHGRHGARDSAVTEEKDGTASALAQRVRHLEQQLSEVLAAAKSSSAATAPVTSTTTGATGRPREPEISNTFLMADEIFAVKQDSQRARYRHAPTEANATTGGLLAKARYLGSSHWVHAMTLFPPSNTLITFLETLKSDKTSEIYQAMTTSKTLGKSIKAARVPRLLTLDFGNHIPSREVADELLDGYLRTFETVYRVLHVPTFRQEYEKYWQNPQGAREVFVIQLQLCMALGAVLRDEKFSLRKLALRWIYEARLWLLQPSEKSRVNLSGMQVWCLVHLSRDLCGVGSDLVWVSAGTMMRMALYIGLHRDPDRLPAMSLLAAESRRRLWATILEILVQSSMESGGPPLISSDDYDCKPPGNYNDEDLVSDTTSPAPLPKPATTFTDSSVQIALLSSTHIRLQIAAYLNSFRSTPSYDKTLDLNSDLTAASRSLDALLRIYQTQSPGVSSFQLSVAEHITQRYFFALHLPWLGFAKDDPRYFFSRKVTVEIAMRNQRKSKAHGSLGSESGRDAPKPDDFGRLLICGTGGYRYVGTQCMLVLTLELIWNLEEQRCALRSVTAGEPASAPACATRPRGIIGLGFGILGAQSDINEEMVEMLNDAATWLRARIKAGEINIKGYLFGKCMLAEIEGLQDGADEEELRRRLRQCATDAAVECLDHLKELSAAEAAQVGMGMTGSAPQATGMGSVAVPRYTGMDGSAVPGPGDGNVYESMDTGTTGTMTDWDWDVFQDPNYNFSLNLNLGGMDLIFGS